MGYGRIAGVDKLKFPRPLGTMPAGTRRLKASEKQDRNTQGISEAAKQCRDETIDIMSETLIRSLIVRLP